VSEVPKEVLALNSEGARAARHYLVLTFCVPIFFVLVILTMSGVAERIETGRPFAAAALLAVGGMLSFALGRWIWRAFRK
jgi:hypothetical protein